jgi:beta-lactamase class A
MSNHHRYLICIIAGVITTTLAIRVISLMALLSPSTNPPIETIQARLTNQLPTQSIAELYQLHRYLQNELEGFSRVSALARFTYTSERRSLLQRREALLQQIQTVEAQIQVNERAQSSWNKALSYASLAAKIGQSPHPSMETLQEAQFLWEEAIRSLHAIPSDSSIENSVTQKIEEYEKYLSITTHRLKVAQSKFLGEVLKQSGFSSQATLVICKITKEPEECRHWRGNQLPENPASLIKIPIALALLHKVNSENITLDTSIYIQPENFTEDRAKIRVRQRYSLKMLLSEMIINSSNIAGNQLIDYLSFDYINQVLRQQGYSTTRVNSKFMGQRIMPANPGKKSNRLTGNELTKMMSKIYNKQYPQSALLIEALNNQQDNSQGIAALKNIAAQWLGEKTGENSKTKGTTLAFTVADETYIVTVIDNLGYSSLTLRRCLEQLVSYIVIYGYL